MNGIQTVSLGLKDLAEIAQVKICRFSMPGHIRLYYVKSPDGELLNEVHSFDEAELVEWLQGRYERIQRATDEVVNG